MKSLLLAGILAVLAFGAGLGGQPAWAACTDGFFVVEGPPLLPNPSAEPPDAVVVGGGMVAIASGCLPVPARIRATRFGTIVRASWAGCAGLAQRVRLRARIEPTCQQMIGVVVARPHFTRPFVAAQCNDSTVCPQRCTRNAECAEKDYCAKGTGQCDAQGTCLPRPDLCTEVLDPVCGCDGHTYGNGCEAAAAGVNVRHAGRCDGAECDVTRPCAEGQFCELATGACASALDHGICVEVPDFCFDGVEPVCGCDGKTYTNDCYRRAAKVQKAQDGACATPECRGPCDCYATRAFVTACPLLCPMCGNFWTCELNQCIEHCGTIPLDLCNALCTVNEQCPAGTFCQKPLGLCDGLGACRERPNVCPQVPPLEPVCGCDGQTYATACEAGAAGVNVAHLGACSSQTPCGPELSCGSTELCVSRGPVGPAVIYSCEPVPAGCELNRTCECAGATLCQPPFDTCRDLDVPGDAIFCDCVECQ